MPAGDDDEDPLPSSYTSAMGTGVDVDVKKSTVESGRFAMLALHNPIIMNPEQHLI